MDKIEKIRQEIERRRDFFYERYIQKGIGCIEETRYDECVEILSFIDSLPDCTVKTSGQGRVKDNVYDSLTEEKPSEDLTTEIEKYFQGLWPGMETVEQCNTDMHFTPPAIMRLATHFYNLGKNAK